MMKFSSLAPASKRMLGACKLLCAASALAALSCAAQARGISELNTDYPTALSVQIDPSDISDEDLNEIRTAGFEFVRFGVRPPSSAHRCSACACSCTRSSIAFA